MPDINFSYLPQRHADVYNVFFLIESPEYSIEAGLFSRHYKNLPLDYFNLTMTYRFDSDVFVPYDYFEPIVPGTPSNDAWSDQEVRFLNNKGLGSVPSHPDT